VLLSTLLKISAIMTAYSSVFNHLTIFVTVCSHCMLLTCLSQSCSLSVPLRNYSLTHSLTPCQISLYEWVRGENSGLGSKNIHNNFRTEMPGSKSTWSICCWQIIPARLQKIVTNQTDGAWALVYSVTGIYRQRCEQQRSTVDGIIDPT